MKNELKTLLSILPLTTTRQQNSTFYFHLLFSHFFLIHLQNELKSPFFTITIHSTLISKFECTQIPSKTRCYYTSLELVWSSKGWHEHG